MSTRLSLLLIVLLSLPATSDAQWVLLNGAHAPLVADGTDLFCAFDSVYRSTDEGSSWQNVSSGLPGKWIRALAVGDTNSYPPLLFAATDGRGLYRSTDYGQSWQAMTTGLPAKWMTAISAQRTAIYAGTDQDLTGDGAYSLGVYRSMDKGVTWTQVNNGLPDSAHGRGVRNFFEMYGIPIVSIDSGIYISSDQGDHWGRMSLPGLYANYIVVVQDTLYVTTPDSISFFENVAHTWRRLDNGIHISNPQGIAVRGHQLFVASDSGVAYSSDLGTSWRSMNKGLEDSTMMRSILIHGDYVFVTQLSGAVYRAALSSFAMSAVAAAHSPGSSFSVYPNPCSHRAMIRVASSEQAVASISVVNEMGVEVAHVFSGTIDAGEHTFEWKTERRLSEGMYECLLRLNGQVQHTPLIIQN